MDVSISSSHPLNKFSKTLFGVSDGMDVTIPLLPRRCRKYLWSHVDVTCQSEKVVHTSLHIIVEFNQFIHVLMQQFNLLSLSDSACNNT